MTEQRIAYLDDTDTRRLRDWAERTALHLKLDVRQVLDVIEYLTDTDADQALLAACALAGAKYAREFMAGIRRI
jgi:hypothetical protein